MYTREQGGSTKKPSAAELLQPTSANEAKALEREHREKADAIIKRAESEGASRLQALKRAGGHIRAAAQANRVHDLATFA